MSARTQPFIHPLTDRTIMSTNTHRPFLYGPHKRDRLICDVLDRLVFDTLPDQLRGVERFAAILDRVEQHGLGIHGFEVENEEGYLDAEVRELYKGLASTDPRWYRTAFQKVIGTHTGPGLRFSACFHVPEELIEAEAVREREEERQRYSNDR